MADLALEQKFSSLGYRLALAEDEGGVWVASAHRLDTGDSFGPPVPADRADEAAELLARWLEWQQAHTAALVALQRAEGAYNRLVAEGALGVGNAAGGRDERRQALEHVDGLRRQLDGVREQRPWPH